MSRLRRIFPGWEPEWSDSIGLWEWANEKRAASGLPSVPMFPMAYTKPLPEHEPLIYFIRMGDLIKIGYTTNLQARLERLTLTTRQVIATEPGGKDREAELRSRFASLRDFKEWFRAEPELLEYIEGPR